MQRENINDLRTHINKSSDQIVSGHKKSQNLKERERHLHQFSDRGGALVTIGSILNTEK